MQLSKQQIEEFRVLYVKEFDKIITEEEARGMVARLINLYLAIYRPLPDESNRGTTRPLGDYSGASFPSHE